MATDTELQVNIDCRKLGESLFAVLKDEIEQQPESNRRRIWALVALRIAEHTGTIDDYRPKPVNTRLQFTREQARDFGREKLPFTGKYGDKPVNEMPKHYLNWLREKIAKDSEYGDRLQAYLESDYVAEEDGSDE